DLLERGLARLDRVEDLFPCAPEEVAGQSQDAGVRGARRVLSKRLAERSQRELAPVALGQDSEARERPHQAVKRAGIHARLRGQLRGAARTIGETVRKLQLRGDEKDARDPVAR